MDPLTDVGGGVSTEVATSLGAKIIKHIGYIFRYKDNLKILKVVEQQLHAKRYDASRFAEDANRQLKDVSRSVLTWMFEADELDRKAQKIISEDYVSCVNLCTRYSASKHALEMAQEIYEMVRAAPDFGTPFYRPPLKLGAKFDLAGFCEFESRVSVVNQIWEALEDDNVRMLSICGMCGTGKTMLAKKLIERAESDHLCDKVSIATVSQSPNQRKIRADIMSSLGWKFESIELETSYKLLDSLSNNDKCILLILDDVWDDLNFEEIGIPLCYNLKILLTSQRDVCIRMGSQRNFSVPLLTDDEAWDFFRMKAFKGGSIDNQTHISELAKEIVNCCEGLPIAIEIIATELKDKSIHVWSDALDRLRTSNWQNLPGMRQVFSRLEVSYDHLDEELKSCFLLCCLFPRGSDILIEDLIRYGTRLGLFENIDNFLEASNRVHSLIDHLKRSFLLLEGDNEDSVKMHNVVRNFSIAVASRDKSYVCCAGEMIKLPETDKLRSCTAMSFVCEEINERPVVLECPELQFLLFVSRRSLHSVNCFFQGIKTGELGKLEILAIKTQTSVELPEEIGLLTNLRVEGERINASLTELESLPITTLEISTKASILPKLPFFKNLVRCAIRLGNTLLTIGKESEENQFVLEGDASYVKGSGISALLNKIEKLRLVRVENVKSFEHFTDDTKQIPTSPDIQLEYFCNLTHLAIESCGDLKHVFTLSLARSLSKIQTIRISDCIKMEGILYGKGEVDAVQFPYLTNLELISVPNLNGFWVDIKNAGAGLHPFKSSDDDTAMKSSTPYWKGSMEEPSASKIESKSSIVAEIGRVQSSFSLFPSWIRLSNLEELRLQGCGLLRVAFPSTVAEQLVKLKTLEIRWCWNMEYIVATVGRPEQKEPRSSVPIPVFPKLRSFIVDDLPELMAFSSDIHFYLEWNSLDELKVSNCPKIKTLSSTFPSDHVIRQDQLLVSTNEILFKIPQQVKGSMNVKLLQVRLCDNLTHLFSSRAAKFLTGIQKIEIRYCEKVKVVVSEEEDEEECELSSLKSVTFDGCFQLKAFSYNNSVNTPNLKDIHINGSKYEIIENINTTIQKVMSSKSRIFDMKELETIEPSQIPDNDTIRDLEIQGCDKLTNAIPCNLIARLQKLEKFAVRWCDSLEEIFEYKEAIKFEEESDLTFSHLAEITLFDLGNLKHIFNKIPKGRTSFQKLGKLYIHGCDSLRNIFSVSSVRGLLQLQELKVSSCNGLKEIVAKDYKEEIQGRDKIVFPQLRNIDISNLAAIECFYSGIYDLVMPLLESFHMNRCPSIKNFSNGLFSTRILQKVQGDCKETLLASTRRAGDADEIVPKKKKRTQIRIYNRKDLQNIGHDQLRHEDLSQIQDLEIQACDELLCAIPWNLIENDLQKLEKLVVRRCHLLEEIFEHRGASIGSGSITTFSNLEEITLFDLGKLQHLFYDIPEATIHFQRLRKLHIHGCNSLSNVFSVSTVNGLPELQELKLSSCDGLEEIVAEGEKQEQGIKDKIVFPQLRSIDIGYSSKISCFYSGIYALELPSLESVFLYKCPCMLTFSNGSLTTPK